MSVVKYRRPLNKNQIHIINLLYKFRYINSRQFAKYLNVNPRVANERLRILLDQDYLGRFYDKSYKLKGDPAIYYLRPKSLAFLKTQTYFNHDAIFIHYRNKISSQTLINHHIKVFDIFQELKNKYDDKYRFITKTELTNKHKLDILMIKPNREQTGIIYISKTLANRNVSTYIQNIINSNDFNDLMIFYTKTSLTRLLQNIMDQYADLRIIKIID